MAVDTDYLDELMKSIEPAIYPDGVPGEEDEDQVEGEGQVEEAEAVEAVDDYELELASIPEKNTASDNEKEVASAIEAIDAENATKQGEAEELNNDISAEDIPEKSQSNAEEGWEEINVSEPAVAEEIELDMNMSEDEIEAMLNAAKSSANEEVSKISEDDDITDILSMLDGDDINDIKDTIEKSDKNIAVDASALDQPEVVIPDIDEEEEPQEDGKKKKAKKKRKSKSEDEAAEAGDDTPDAEAKKKKKKGGLFGKLFNALTEEVPEEVPEQSETGITDENAQILSELDSEDKGKKKKKKKKSKGKDKQSEASGDERDIREKSDDEDEEGAKGKKKAKKEKKPKIKKVKEPEKPSKKLPKKRVRNTFILCLSILAAILVLAVFGTEYLNKKQARYAFDNADYETAYADLYGFDLGDSDNEIYQKSRTIMFMQRKWSSYENYMQLGMKAEALNSLLEGYKIYPAVMEKAQEYGVEDQVKEVYDKIIAALSGFGLSSADADEINSYTSEVAYNKRILSIVNGTPFEYRGVDISDNNADTEQEDTQNSMQDILPEEEDFLPDNPEEIFQD